MILCAEIDINIVIKKYNIVERNIELNYRINNRHAVFKFLRYM